MGIGVIRAIGYDLSEDALGLPVFARIEQDILLGKEDAAGLAVVPELARAVKARRAVDIDYYSAGRGASSPPRTPR